MKKLLIVTLFALSFSALANEHFEYAVNKLICFEGEKLDRSIGKTYSKYGITRPTLKRYNGRTDIENLTKETAKKIIKKLYWDEFELDRIIDSRSALLVLDFVYNSNGYNAIKQIQKAIGNKVTGKLSTSDIIKINYMSYKDFYKLYSKHRLNYMKSLGKKWKKFGSGWYSRVKKLGEL